MTLFIWKAKARAMNPRLNVWKGARASETTGERRYISWAKIFWRGRIALRVGQWALGLGVLICGLTVVTREMGPALQQWLEIREVEIEGIQHVTKLEVLELLALKPKMALHQVSTTFLAERVQAHAWIREAKVERRFPHMLQVTVVEWTPAAIIRAGDDYWLSAESGHLLAKLGPDDDLALPLLLGLAPKSFLQNDLHVRSTVESGIVLAKLIAKTIDGRIEVDLANPLNVVVSVDGMRFQFGTDSLVDQWVRYQKVKQSVKPGITEKRKHEIGEVDLRYVNRVIVRERG